MMFAIRQEFDGSDSGARPDEAISWGKIKIDAQPVKVRMSSAFIVFIYWGQGKTPVSTHGKRYSYAF